MSNYAIVALDKSGSMNGEQERVVSAMNEYVESIPDDSHISVFMFDSGNWSNTSINWNKYYEGPVKDWSKMEVEDYQPRGGTPLFDSVGKAIVHAEGLASKGDKVMLMIDTDGEENMSSEYNQQSIKALVDEKKEKGWAFLFMSSGLDIVSARRNSSFGVNLGMATQTANLASRADHYHHASFQTTNYFVQGTAPESVEIDDNTLDEDLLIQPQESLDKTEAEVVT